MERSFITLRNPDAGPIGTTLPTWKLYDNPHYSECRHDSSLHLHSYNRLPPHVQLIFGSTLKPSLVGHLAAFFRPTHCDGAPSELELARAQIGQLKAELESERRMRRKAESLNKAMARKLADERKAREAADGLCKRLEEKLARKVEEVDRVLRDIEEERRMLRVAEMWREERVQMKLSEARLLMEDKLQEMAAFQSKREIPKKNTSMLKIAAAPRLQSSCGNAENSAKRNAVTLGSTSQCIQHGQQRRGAENPHIKRGIKGFVEYPRVVRVHSSSKEGRANLGSNLECQRAQLRVLLRQRNPAGLGLFGTSENLVMR